MYHQQEDWFLEEESTCASVWHSHIDNEGQFQLFLCQEYFGEIRCTKCVLKDSLGLGAYSSHAPKEIKERYIIKNGELK